MHARRKPQNLSPSPAPHARGTTRAPIQRRHAPVVEPAALYVPSGHAAPVADVTAPRGSQKRPATGVQGPLHAEVAEPPLPYRPAGHGTHTVAPAVDEKVPAGHGGQLTTDEPFVENLPAGHTPLERCKQRGEMKTKKRWSGYGERGCRGRANSREQRKQQAKDTKKATE